MLDYDTLDIGMLDITASPFGDLVKVSITKKMNSYAECHMLSVTYAECHLY